MNGRGLSTKAKLAVMAVPILAMAVVLICLVPLMRPVRQGAPAGFWYAACRVKLATFDSIHGDEALGIRPARDGLWIYYSDGFSGAVLYALKESDALAYLPEVIQKLDAELGKKGPLTDTLRVYKKWRAAGGNLSNVAALLEQEHEVMRERLGRRLYAGGRQWLKAEKSFEQAWPKFRRYPMYAPLEFLYLSGVVVFGFWPWLRRLKPWRWALHIGLLPILLSLPNFLGYCPAFGRLNPSGWVLYPWMAVWFQLLGGISRPFDTVVLFSLPKPLAGLCGYNPATTWDIYDVFWDMGFGMSASSLIALSTGLAVVTYIAAWLIRRRKERKMGLGATGRNSAHNAARIARAAGVITCFLVALCLAAVLLQLRGEVLINAARLGNVAWARAILLARPRLIHARDDRRRTALHCAENAELVELLLSKSADVNARDEEGRTPLDNAVEWGKNPTVDLLLAHGADARSADIFGNTPLHRACYGGDALAAETLLSHGADVTVRNTDGWTPLHAAEDADVAKVLLAAGADVNAKDRWGDTPLHKIRWKWKSDGNDDLIKVLLAGGANVNARANDGSTPLHILASSYNVADAKLLIANGADVNAEDGDGFRPLDYAGKTSCKDMRDALLQAGARE